jgi:hypothetical protein
MEEKQGGDKCAIYQNTADCDVWPHCSGPKIFCGAEVINPKLEKK